MTNTATIEVFGPLDAVERAVTRLPGVVSAARNGRGSLVVDLGDEALIVAPDVGLTVVIVDGPHTDAQALVVFEQLAGVLPYAMDLTDADSTGIIRHRGAVSAA